MTDKYTALRDALAAGPTPGPWRNSEVDLRTCQVALVTEGFGVYSGSAEVAMPKVDAAYIAAASPDTIAALLDERDRLREALAIARDYAADEIAYLRAAFRGYEELGKVPDAEADLARIDAALGGPNAHP